MDEEHDRFERDIISFLNEANFLGDSTTYHDKMAKPIADRLARIQTLTTLCVRTRADRVAIHEPSCAGGQPGLVFQWEAKTGGLSKWKTPIVEALPLMFHRHAAKWGVKTMYMHRDLDTETERGFHAHNPPRILRTFLPDRWTDSQGRLTKVGSQLDKVLRHLRPGDPRRVKWKCLPKNKRPSGDPYVSLELDDAWFDWKQEILRIADEAIGRRVVPLS